MVTYHPSILPPSANPEGSVRYENITIILEEIPEEFEDVAFYDDLEHNRFIIEQHSISFKEYQARIFKGTVLRESNGDYSWWRNLL